MGSIDVHAHLIPHTYLAALSALGIGEREVGFPLEPWDARARLDLMDRNDIDVEVLSLSSPGLRYWRGREAASLARKLNDELAALVAAHPTRFGGFATLPLPDVDAALREVAHAFDDLGLDGAVLMTNYEGRYLGHPDFAPVLDELNRRRAVLFVHPTEGPSNDLLTQGYPAPAFEYPADTTRMVVSLIDTDVVARCPDLKIIASHGGGTLPILQTRLAMILPWKRREDPAEGAERVNRAIGSLFYDTAIASYPAPLAALHLTHETSRLLTGYDLPFFPEKGIAPERRNLADFDAFSDADRESILSGNALRLLPRVAAARR